LHFISNETLRGGHQLLAGQVAELRVDVAVPLGAGFRAMESICRTKSARSVEQRVREEASEVITMKT
jgi:hypothetical protein